MKKFYSLIVCVMVVGSLVACGKSATPGDVEAARKAIKSNAESTAKAYRNENFTAEHKITVLGDSTVSVDCPMGDGWSSVEIKDPSGKVAAKIKCSTYSASIGCLTDQQYIERKQYNTQDGKCGKSWVPYPIELIDAK